MKTIIIIMLSIFNFSVAAKQFVYTNVSRNNCAIIENNEEYDSMKYECPSLGNYRIHIDGADLRYGLTLQYKGDDVALPEIDPFHMPGSSVIEWRYKIVDGKVNYYGLLFRLEISTGNPGETDSILYAVRLNGKKSCVINQYRESNYGHGAENVLARKLLDSDESRCVELDEY